MSAPPSSPGAVRSKPPAMSQRAAPRIRALFSSLYSSERREGTAELFDISYTGARLEKASLLPRLKSRVRIHVFLPGEETPLELVGHVIRHTETGFAVQYEKPVAGVRKLVDSAAAFTAVTAVELD